MTTFNCKIQLSESYSDVFQQKGTIDLEKAIEEFQSFPWDKEIENCNRRTDCQTVPKIIFSSDDKKQLIIGSFNLAGFDIEYINSATNKYSEFYISNDFEKNNWTVEEIIEFFFNDSIESYLTLENNPINKPEAVFVKTESSSTNIEFNFNPKHLKIIGFSFFMFFSISVVLFIIGTSFMPFFFQVIVTYPWLPTIFLHLTYYIKNNGAKVIIDKKNHDLTYIKGTKEIKFNRDDILKCQITIKSSTKGTWGNYSFVWFALKDGSYVAITCFIADPHEIVKALNCKFEVEERTIPLLPI